MGDRKPLLKVDDLLWLRLVVDECVARGCVFEAAPSDRLDGLAEWSDVENIVRAKIFHIFRYSDNHGPRDRRLGRSHTLGLTVYGADLIARWTGLSVRTANWPLYAQTKDPT